jgi:hypothetical protein
MHSRSYFLALLVRSLMAIGTSAFSLSSLAMPSPIKVTPERFSKTILAGALTGGEAAGEFSLLAVIEARDSSLAKDEKITMVYGTKLGKTLSGPPGFFHVALDRGGRRIVIDLAQISRTAVDPGQLEKSLSHSKFVASTDMTMDPQDGSTNLTLNLKTPVELSVATETKNASVVLKLQAAQAGSSVRGVP